MGSAIRRDAVVPVDPAMNATVESMIVAAWSAAMLSSLLVPRLDGW
jgi:hypothetical protein